MLSNSMGTKKTTAPHATKPAHDVGSVAHTATASTAQATVNGRAAPMPWSR